MNGNSNRLELMSPAGGPEAGFAAIQYGADSIYLGLQQFSARADADNFSPADLETVIAYAHAQSPRRRVFAAVNTLVLESELPALVEELGRLADLGADAVIVQDLGVAHLVRRHFPALRLHASTQLAVHNREGVEALRRFGFARATLARELTLREIRDIATVPGIETEVFIHGALCYCYSGLCLYSSMTTGRSGNRGRCAYLCRDRFSSGAAGAPPADSGRFVFSMKDLALPDAIDALGEAGVSSLKIEGRKKSALFVAAVTSFYRRLIDGAMSDAERRTAEADIQSVFSRPWTTLFADSPHNLDLVDPDTVGHRGAPAGQLERIVAGPGRSRRLRFRTTCPVELHDGLQLDVPGQDRPFGFAVDRLFLVGRPGIPSREVFSAPADSVIDVELPPNHPHLPDGSTVYRSSSQDVKKRYRHDMPRPGDYRIRHSLGVRLSLSAGGLAAHAVAPRILDGDPDLSAAVMENEALSPARDAASVPVAARGAFEKLGDTRWSLTDFQLENPDRLFAPVSVLNRVRRAMCDRLEEAWQDRVRLRQETIVAQLAEDSMGSETVADPAPHWSIKTDQPESLSELSAADWAGVDEVIVEIGGQSTMELNAALTRLAAKAGAERIRLALPVITRSWESPHLHDSITTLIADGWRRWQAANMSAWSFLPLDKVDLAADWPLYSMNPAAIREWTSAGVSSFTFSPEDGFPNLRGLLPRFGRRGTVVVYQDTPLFISETCVRAASTGRCPGPADCDFHEDRLVSSHGDALLAVNRRCRMFVIGERPLCWSERVPELIRAGARRFRADFILRPYAPGEIPSLWRRIRNGDAVPNTQAGNWDRGLA